MKVLHVLETSVPNTVGYTVRANAIIESQKKLGLEVVVITSPLFPTQQPEVRSEVIQGVRYYRTNHIPVPASAKTRLGAYWRRWRMLMRYREEILRVATAERVDVIHTHSSYLNAHAAHAAARKLGVPMLYEVRTLWGESAVVEDGWRANSLKHRMIWRLELAAMRKADVVLPISRGIYEELARRGIPREKMRIIPNGVDSAKFMPLPRDAARAQSIGMDGRFIVGFIGSMRRLEGLTTLMEAHRICRERGVQLGVVLVGDGPDRAHVEARARELGLSDVLFTGNVPHAEVSGWYSIMDVVVYPRIRAVINERVTPLKPLEVMALGKVCVGSDVGGLMELIQDGVTGRTFRADDAAHLADVLLQLQSDRAGLAALGARALEYVRREREWLVIVEQDREIYDSLLAARRLPEARMSA